MGSVSDRKSLNYGYTDMYCPFLDRDCLPGKCQLYAFMGNPMDDPEKKKGGCSFRWIPVLADMWLAISQSLSKNGENMNKAILKMIDILKDDGQKELKELVEKLIDEKLGKGA